MKNNKNKELNSATRKSAEPMFENNIKDAIENAASISFTSLYVVTRDGYRVSDREYTSVADKDALNEMKFWNKVSKNHSWGEKVEIVQYDSKKHRVW